MMWGRDKLWEPTLFVRAGFAGEQKGAVQASFLVPENLIGHGWYLRLCALEPVNRLTGDQLFAGKAGSYRENRS